MDRPEQEAQPGQLKNNLLDWEERRLDVLIKKVANAQVNGRIYKIDIASCAIIEILGSNDSLIPVELLMNATPETLIKNTTAAEYCRGMIASVHKTGNPISISIPITINNKTITRFVHFKRGSRETDANTVIAYTNDNNPTWTTGDLYVADRM